MFGVRVKLCIEVTKPLEKRGEATISDMIPGTGATLPLIIICRSERPGTADRIVLSINHDISNPP